MNIIIKVLITIIVLALIAFASFYFYKINPNKTIMPNTNENTAVSKNVDGKEILAYGSITFTAPNSSDKPYYVFAVRENKIIWEIDSYPSNKGGVERMVVANMKETDFNTGDNYEQMKQKYLGKLVLYIYYSEDSAINRLSSWQIVDIDTGEKISFIGAF